ncbi:hypothetical protein MY5147_001797 [Beauveria neobassiana]
MAATKTETELAEKEKRDRAAVVSAERGEDTAGKPVLNAPQGEHNFEISENRYAQIAGTAAWRQDPINTSWLGQPVSSLYGDLSGTNCGLQRLVGPFLTAAYVDRCPKNVGREPHSGTPQANGAASDKGSQKRRGTVVRATRGKRANNCFHNGPTLPERKRKNSNGTLRDAHPLPAAWDDILVHRFCASGGRSWPTFNVALALLVAS